MQGAIAEETRNKLAAYWANHEIKQGEEFAILTNIIHQEWSGVSVKQHKAVKGLTDHNLRDHMSGAELIFTALAELSTRQIAESMNASGMEENEGAAKQGCGIAKRARKELENKTGKKVVLGSNYLPGDRGRQPVKPRAVKKKKTHCRVLR